MNYIMCVPLVEKSANTIVNKYIKEIYCRFRGSHKTLSNNRSQFKNSLFSEEASQRIKHIHSPNIDLRQIEEFRHLTNSQKLH